METSTASTLPEFGVKLFHIDEPGGKYDMLEVRCPRKECGETFWVPLSWRVLRPVLGSSLLPPARPFGRPCPCCSRAAAVPEEWRRSDPTDLNAVAKPTRMKVKVKRRSA